MPCLCGVAADSVFVVMLAARLSLVAHTLPVQILRHEHRHFLSRSSLHSDFRKSRQVLSHVSNEGVRRDAALGLCRCRCYGVGRQIMPLLDGEALHNLHRRCRLGNEFSIRSLRQHGVFPFRVVEVGEVEPTLCQSGVERFSAVDTVEGNGAEGIFPRPVADNRLTCAVAVVYLQSQYHLRRTEAGHQLAVSVATLHVEESVAEQKAYGIVTSGEQ